MKVNIVLDTEELKVPDGWEVVGVRIANRGEYYLSSCGSADTTYTHWDTPRFIVKKTGE